MSLMHFVAVSLWKFGITELTVLCSCLQVTQSEEPDINDMSVGLLSISAYSTDATFFCPERTAVVLEGNIVVELPTLADAFALMYALHLSYPKELANTFDFTQKILMCLEDGKLRPRVLTLKNNLLSVE